MQKVIERRSVLGYADRQLPAKLSGTVLGEDSRCPWKATASLAQITISNRLMCAKCTLFRIVSFRSIRTTLPIEKFVGIGSTPLP